MDFWILGGHYELGILGMKYCSPNKPRILQQNAVNVCHTVCGKAAYLINIPVLDISQSIYWLCCVARGNPMCVTRMRTPLDQFPPFNIRGPKKKKKKEGAFSTDCMCNSLYSVWLFFLQSHTACKVNWIQEYPTTYDKSPLHISLPVAAAWQIYELDKFAICIPFLQLLHRRCHALSRFGSGLSYCMRPGPRCRPACTALLFSLDANAKCATPFSLRFLSLPAILQAFV